MQLINHLRYSFHVIFRPFDGFWDLKHEKRGSLKGAIVILMILIVTTVIKKQNTGFLFSTSYSEDFNIFMEIISVILPFALWCISNWCLTTLIDGKAKLSDIVTVTAYAITPLIIINLPMTIVSNVIILEEGAFYHFFINIAFIWSALLLLIGTMTVQQFTFAKTIFTSILTIIGMGIMIFIGLLLFTLIYQMYDYIVSLYNEIIFRL